jgi:hypothetical protein
MPKGVPRQRASRCRRCPVKVRIENSLCFGEEDSAERAVALAQASNHDRVEAEAGAAVVQHLSIKSSRKK